MNDKKNNSEKEKNINWEDPDYKAYMGSSCHTLHECKLRWMLEGCEDLHTWLLGYLIHEASQANAAVARIAHDSVSIIREVVSYLMLSVEVEIVSARDKGKINSDVSPLVENERFILMRFEVKKLGLCKYCLKYGEIDEDMIHFKKENLCEKCLDLIKKKIGDGYAKKT